MSRFSHILLTMALLVSINIGTGKAQVYFSKQIDWQNQYEYLGGIVATDSFRHFILAGGSLSLEPYLDKYFIATIDSLGNTISSGVFLPAAGLSGNAGTIVNIDSQNSLVQGNASVLNSNGSEELQVFLIKIDNQTGDTIWTKRYEREGWKEVGWKTIRTLDGGSAVVGWTFLATNAPPEKILFLKMDSLGNLVFRKEYTTSSLYNHRGWAIAEAADGGCLLLCSDTYEGYCPGCLTDTYISDLILLKTDAQGNQQWVKKYSPWEWKQAGLAGFVIHSLYDGNYLTGGFKHYEVLNQVYSNYYRYMFFKFNQDGEILDSLSFGGYGGALLTNIIPISEGNYLLTAAERDSSYGTGNTGVVMKITLDLQVLWKREYRISPPESLYHEKFYDAVEMPDKGFIVCGRTYENGTNSNGWVIRVDSLGCLEPGCDTIFTDVQGPPQGADAGILLSPNPTGGEVRLALADPEAVLLGARLLDMQGRVLEDVQFRREAGWRECVLNLAGQPAGMYMVQVRTSQGWAVRKVVKA